MGLMNGKLFLSEVEGVKNRKKQPRNFRDMFLQFVAEIPAWYLLTPLECELGKFCYQHTNHKPICVF